MGSLLGQRLTKEVLSIGNNEHKDDGSKKGSNQGAQPVAVEDNPQILLDQSPCLADKHHLLDGKGSLTVGQDPGPSSSCMYRPGRECTVDSRQRKSKKLCCAPIKQNRGRRWRRAEESSILGTAAEMSSQPCKAKHSR